jgi:hypothetical protein
MATFYLADCALERALRYEDGSTQSLAERRATAEVVA